MHTRVLAARPVSAAASVRFRRGAFAPAALFPAEGLQPRLQHGRLAPCPDRPCLGQPCADAGPSRPSRGPTRRSTCCFQPVAPGYTPRRGAAATASQSARGLRSYARAAQSCPELPSPCPAPANTESSLQIQAGMHGVQRLLYIGMRPSLGLQLGGEAPCERLVSPP